MWWSAHSHTNSQRAIMSSTSLPARYRSENLTEREGLYLFTATTKQSHNVHKKCSTLHLGGTYDDLKYVERFCFCFLRSPCIVKAYHKHKNGNQESALPCGAKQHRLTFSAACDAMYSTYERMWWDEARSAWFSRWEIRWHRPALI